MKARSPIWPDDGIILYDGICVLCSAWVRFVVKRDVARRFRFTPIESPYGRRLAEALEIDPDDPDTNAVVLNGIALRRSDAALAVVSTFPGWGWVRVCRFVPRLVRDGFYTLIARNRYRLFGRRAVCDLGDASFADRVIVQGPIGCTALPLPTRAIR
jgi:predicted DCC family thiol-disulfide oxidoreductase YuxK